MASNPTEGNTNPQLVALVQKLIQEGLQAQQKLVMEALNHKEEEGFVSVVTQTSTNKRTRDSNRNTSPTSHLAEFKSLVREKLSNNDPHQTNKLWTAMEVCCVMFSFLTVPVRNRLLVALQTHHGFIEKTQCAAGA